MKSWQERSFLLALVTVTAVLQVTIAGRQSLWADEIFSLAIATGHSLEHPSAVAQPGLGDFVEPNHPETAGEFRRYLKHDNPPASPARVIRAVLLSDTSPPLYYLMLYGWTLVFGTGDVAVRLFSVACALLCFPLLADIARRTGGKQAVIPSAILFAFSPLGIYYSTEARMYSLLWLCMLAMTWASLVLHERGGSIAMGALWIGASTAGLLTHYFFVFPWLAVVFYLAIRPGKLKRWHVATATLLAAALILPWYANLPESLGAWRITKDWLNWQPWHFSRMVATLELATQFFDGRGKYLWPSHRMWSVAALMIFAIIAGVLVWRRRQDLFRSHLALLWLPFVAACAGPLVFDLVRNTYTVAVPRYAIAALPGAYLLAALGLACLKFRTRMFVLVLIVAAWAPSVFSIYRQRARCGEPFEKVSRAVSLSGASSDLILVHSIPSGVLGVARYAKESAVMASWVGQLGNRQVPEAVNALAAGRKRIFFVRIHDVGEPAPEEDWLRAHALVFQETRLRASEIIEFRPNSADAF